MEVVNVGEFSFQTVPDVLREKLEERQSVLRERSKAILDKYGLNILLKGTKISEDSDSAVCGLKLPTIAWFEVLDDCGECSWNEVDVENDFERERYFHEKATRSCSKFKRLLSEERDVLVGHDSTILDMFCESVEERSGMVKGEVHMSRIEEMKSKRVKELHEKVDARRQRELKEFGKKIQTQRLKEKQDEKNKIKTKLRSVRNSFGNTSKKVFKRVEVDQPGKERVMRDIELPNNFKKKYQIKKK